MSSNQRPGLINLGNTCFMNAMIQALLSARPLRAHFIEAVSAKDIDELALVTLQSRANSGDVLSQARIISGFDVSLVGKEGPLTQSFRKFLREVLSSSTSGGTSNRVVNPLDLHSSLVKVAPRFKGFRQHDSHELLRSLLNGFWDEEIVRMKGVLKNRLDISIKSIEVLDTETETISTEILVEKVKEPLTTVKVQVSAFDDLSTLTSMLNIEAANTNITHATRNVNSDTVMMNQIEEQVDSGNPCNLVEDNDLSLQMDIFNSKVNTPAISSTIFDTLSKVSIDEKPTLEILPVTVTLQGQESLSSSITHKEEHVNLPLNTPVVIPASLPLPIPLPSLPPTFVERIFGGSLISVIECSYCYYKSVTEEPFLDLSLPLSNDMEKEAIKAAELAAIAVKAAETQAMKAQLLAASVKAKEKREKSRFSHTSGAKSSALVSLLNKNAWGNSETIDIKKEIDYSKIDLTLVDSILSSSVISSGASISDAKIKAMPKNDILLWMEDHGSVSFLKSIDNTWKKQSIEKRNESGRHCAPKKVQSMPAKQLEAHAMRLREVMMALEAKERLALVSKVDSIEPVVKMATRDEEVVKEEEEEEEVGGVDTVSISDEPTIISNVSTEDIVSEDPDLGDKSTLTSEKCKENINEKELQVPLAFGENLLLNKSLSGNILSSDTIKDTVEKNISVLDESNNNVQTSVSSLTTNTNTTNTNTTTTEGVDISYSTAGRYLLPPPVLSSEFSKNISSLSSTSSRMRPDTLEGLLALFTSPEVLLVKNGDGYLCPSCSKGLLKVEKETCIVGEEKEKEEEKKDENIEKKETINECKNDDSINENKDCGGDDDDEKEEDIKKDLNHMEKNTETMSFSNEDRTITKQTVATSTLLSRSTLSVVNSEPILRDFSKRLLLSSSKLPHILTIHLKRFKQVLSSRGKNQSRISGGNLVKVSAFVDIPLELDLTHFIAQEVLHSTTLTSILKTMNLNEECILNDKKKLGEFEKKQGIYRLLSIVVHSGSLGSGHYFAYVKNASGIWYCCNDSNVSQVSVSEVLKAEAYICLYERV